MSQRAFTPRRRRGIEYLDGDAVPPDDRARAYADLALSNRLFGGLHAVAAEISAVLSELPAETTVLDVGAGDADIPHRLKRLAAGAGVNLRVLALDCDAALLASGRARARTDHAVCANALALPFADRSVDVVVCSQVLHHFERPEAVALLAELHRVARRRVIVADLQRSWMAVGGWWLVSFPLSFHPVTRHDGVVSILRGFTAEELRGMVEAATGTHASVRRRLGYRLTASWAP